MPSTSLSFRPTLNELRGEITVGGVQERARDGNKCERADIITLDIMCWSMCVCLYHAYVFVQINVNSGTVPSVYMDINFECMSDSSPVFYVGT